MDFSTPQFSAVIPELFLLAMVAVVLLVNVYVGERNRFASAISYYLTQAVLITVFFITLPQFKEYPAPIITFAGNYILDKLAVLTKLIIYVFSFFAFIYAKDYLKVRQISRGDYYLLGLFAVLGMSIMASAYSFLTIYLGLELLSLALYAMVAMPKDGLVASEAAMKYFILGSLASGMLLYGISLIYGITGSIQINLVANALGNEQTLLSLVALAFIVGGLIFKFGAVPFHMWVPDVYQGAATPTTLFIASAPKVAAFAVTLRFLVQALPTLTINWQWFLIIIAVLSMFFGNVLAIAQTNLKRMLAYSSIAHIGYTLLGILAGPDSSDGYSAAMFYITTYVLVAAGAFAIIAIMSRHGVEIEDLQDYRGLNARSPWLAFIMLLLMFSMAGVPPTVGFFAKLGLLQALVQGNFVWLAVLALVFALIGAYYYLRVVMLMYFEEPIAGKNYPTINLSTETFIAISVNGAAALLLGLLPSFLIDICRITVG